jgi:L-malate glycosyltransferase
MKNILIISHGAALGGSPISGLNIGRFIDKNSFQTVYLFGENGPIVEQARREGFRVYVAKKRGFLSIPLILDVIKIIKKESIDIIHLNTLTSYYKYPAIAAKLLKKKVAWFVRENPEEKRCVKLAKYINNYADKIVTVSYDTAEHMYYADKNKLMTIHNGIDLEKYQIKNQQESLKTLALDDGFEYITTIASIEQRKGILDLLEAFNMIHLKYPTIKLLIVGKDRTEKQEYLHQVESFINKNNLQDKVILFGETTLIQEIMSISKVFVLCAYWEGLSRVLLEAMACSKAIVASKNGGNKEQVFDDINGYTFEAGDIKKLANCIEKCLEQDLSEFENNSRRLAIEKFDIKVTTIRIENLYKFL